MCKMIGEANEAARRALEMVDEAYTIRERALEMSKRRKQATVQCHLPLPPKDLPPWSDLSMMMT